MALRNAIDDSNWTVRQALVYSLQPSILMRSLVASGIIWLIMASATPSYSRLIFEGKLSGYFAAGLAIALASQLVMVLITSLFSSDPSTIGLPQSPSAVIQGLLAGVVIETAPPDMPEETLFAVVFLFIALSSLLAGVFMLLLGITRVGDLVRYFPYPIVGGFMAGLGWLMLDAGFVVAADLKLNFENLSLLLEGDAIARWLPALLLSLCIVGLQARIRSALIMPGAILLSVILFYAWARIIHGDLPALVEAGWFLPNLPDVIYWQMPNLGAIAQITPAMLFASAGGIVMTIVQCALNLFFKASAQEMVTDRELDFNQECRVNGIANIAGGVAGGGIVGYHIPSMTAVVEAMSAYGRLVGVLLALMFGLTIVFGSTVYSVTPRFLPAGLLMFVGVLFLKQWLWDSRARLPRQDYVVVVVIALVTAFFGLLAGFFAGIIVAISFFVLEYSRINVIKQQFSGSIHRSNLDRSFAQNELLKREGDSILVLRLQGYMFFGTAYRFYEYVKTRIEERADDPLRFIILDFLAVRGFDVSTSNDFKKLKRLTDSHNIELLISGLAPELQPQLADGGITRRKSGESAIFESLDYAMEDCETHLLREADLLLDAGVTVEQQLAAQSPLDPEDLETLRATMERIETKVGDIVFNQGDPPDAMYFIESGRVDVLLHLPDDQVLRLRSMSGGTVIGEVGFYLKQARGASVVVAEAGVLQRLSHDALREMERSAPHTAASIHFLMSCILSDRLSTSNRVVQDLMA